MKMNSFFIDYAAPFYEFASFFTSKNLPSVAVNYESFPYSLKFFLKGIIVLSILACLQTRESLENPHFCFSSYFENNNVGYMSSSLS